MMSVLELPVRELEICLRNMRGIPREQHRRFLDVVADEINPLRPCDLTIDVICACAYARWFVMKQQT
jgi:hypothetical protein